MSGRADIFGNDTSSNLDVSDEALADKWENDSTQVEPEPSDDGVASGEDEDPDEDDHDAEVDDAEDDPDEDPSEEDPEDKSVLPDKLKGKSPEEIAKMYVELERRFGQEQSGEIGELRRQVEQQQQQLAQLAASGQQDYAGGDDISDYISDSHSAATIYGQAIDALGEGQINVNVIDEIIDATHAIDPLLASKMNRDFGMRLARAESMAQMEPVRQSNYDSTLLRVTNELYEDNKLGGDVKAYEQEIAGLLRGKDLGNTAAEIRNHVEQALIVARGQDPTKSVAYQAATLAASKKNSQVEEGSGEPPEAVTEEDQIRKRVFSTRGRGGGQNIFAGFGGN